MKPPIFMTVFFALLIAGNVAFVILDQRYWFNAAVAGWCGSLVFTTWVQWWVERRPT